MQERTKQTLDYAIEGPDDAPILVFVHGWPDDASMWRHQVAELKASYRCVSVTLPNFGSSAHEIGGCDFPDIVERLRNTIEALTQEPVTLIIHDWGAYIGYLYEQQFSQEVTSVIALDIGGHIQATGIRDALMFVSYQWMLALLWLLGGVLPPLATWLSRHFARMLKIPESKASTLHSRFNYPYFYFWRSNFVPWLRSRLLGDYTPGSPVLFLYGGNKPLMFHSARWLKLVEQSGGESVCLEQGSHWFMEEEIERTNALIKDWLVKQN